MGITESIAATSMTMSSLKLQMGVSTSLTKKAMANQEVQAQQLLQMLPSTPGLGEIVDTNA